jgi:DNA-binding transcriptional regulator YiaG
MNRKTVISIKEAWKNHYKEMTHEDILLVLEMFPSSFSVKDISYFFDVHESTVKDWKNGKNKPNGANKIVFNTILFQKEIVPKNK